MNEVIVRPDLSKLNAIKQNAVEVLKSPYGAFYATLIAGVSLVAIYNNYGISFNTNTGILSLAPSVN